MDIHAVITQFAPALARVVASYERDRALQDELLQDVLIAIFASLPRLTQEGKLKPFVFRIAHNRCLTHVAKRMRERAHEAVLDESSIATASHEQTFIERERSDRLLEAVRQLTLPYRQVMTLILEDMSYEEIAETLGITVANVGIRVNRAKQQLKGLLGHE
jgi:RNA polymerase sigma-70 factor (ECF subfamily)